MGVTKTLLHTVYVGGDDAVAAIERLAKEWREMLEQSASEIEELRERVPQWTPVSERLPEEGQEVLAWNNGGQCEKPWQGHVLCVYRNGEWRESQECDLYPGISHWMPLPEPPDEA